MSGHVLLTAWAFAPARTSGVYRAIALANAFAADGWDVTVLTAPPKVFSDEGLIDASLPDQVDERVVVQEVSFESTVHSSDISEWSRARARHPELWGAFQGRRFPELGYGGWYSALMAAAEQVHQDKPVDLSLGTAGPSVDFVPGWHLKRRHGVPTVMDYRDAWTIDVFTGDRQARATSRTERWERRMLAAADQIWFVNEPIREWHEQKHPSLRGRTSVVPNGFDLVDGRSPAVPFQQVQPQDALRFGYIGTINTGQFPTGALLAGWIRARELDEDIARASISLRGHLGRTGVADPALAAFLGRASEYGIHYDGPVAKADVAQAYASFDGLVLALASGRGVTSGKVFEFAGSGLPVVSVHDPESAATGIMAGSPVWTPNRSLNEDHVAEAFIAAARTIRAQTPQLRAEAIAWGARWERMHQLKQPVRELRTLTKRSIL